MKKQPRTTTHKPPSSQSPIFNLLFYTLLTLLLTHPLIFHLTTTVPHDIGDPLLNTWILAWDSHALLTDPLNLFNANIFHPLPNTLAYSEHLIGTLAFMLPLHLIFAEPVLTYNVALLLTFPLSAFGMYLLALRWTGRRDAAFIAGLIFAFAPYRFAAIAHLQLLTFHWLPFALLYLDKILASHRTTAPPAGQRSACKSSSLSPPNLPLQGGGAKTSPLAGEAAGGRSKIQGPRSHHLAFTTFLLLQLLSSWYLAVYTLLIITVYIFTHFLTRSIKLTNLYPLLPAFLLTGLISLPFVRPYLNLLNDLQVARPLSQALALAAAPTDYLAAAPFNTLFGPLTSGLRDRVNFTEENVLFVGFVAPILAVIALLNVKKNQPPSLLFLLITLGVTIGLTFPLPYQALATLIPPSTIIRVPPRWLIPALFALAPLAAFGFKHLQRFLTSPFTIHYSLLTIILSALLLLESLSLPLPLAPVTNHQTLNPAYHWLAQQPAPLALLELPLHSAPAPEFPEVKRLYASTTGWWNLVNGYSGYTPPRQPQLAQALVNFPEPTAFDPLQVLADESGESLYLLVHPGEVPFERSAWETTLRWQAERNPLLRPVGVFAGDYLYQVVSPDVTNPPLATFGLDQSIQILAAELDLTSDLFPPRLILIWRSTQPQSLDATIFIHLRAADGFVRAQADGPPVSGYYPLTHWQPGEVVQDIHILPEDDYSQVDHWTMGLYDPATGERFLAFDREGQPLAEQAFVWRK